MTTTLTIQGIHCDACVQLITMELQDIEGVDTVSISYASNQGTALVTHTKELSRDDVVQALAEAGEYTLIDFNS